MPSDAPERVFLWFREPAHPIAFSQPQVDDKGDPWPEYVRVDLLAARDAEIARLREYIASAPSTPNPWTHRNQTGDHTDFVSDADLTAAREALRLAAPIARDLIMQWAIANGLTPEGRREGMTPSIAALRAIVAILPDALDGAPEWIVDAVKQEKPE